MSNHSSSSTSNSLDPKDNNKSSDLLFDLKDFSNVDTKHLQTLLKAQKIKNNKSWNSRIENVITNIANDCNNFEWKHKKDATKYQRYDNYLGFAVIFINTLTGTSIFATLNFNQSSQEMSFIHIVTALIIWFGGMIAAVQKYFGFKEKIDRHILACKEWTNLYFSIQKQLYFYRYDRQDAKEFLEDTMNKYVHLIMNSPNISNSTSKASSLTRNRNKLHIINIENLEKMFRFHHKRKSSHKKKKKKSKAHPDDRHLSSDSDDQLPSRRENTSPLSTDYDNLSIHDDNNDHQIIRRKSSLLKKHKSRSRSPTSTTIFDTMAIDGSLRCNTDISSASDDEDKTNDMVSTAIRKSFNNLDYQADRFNQNDDSSLTLNINDPHESSEKKTNISVI